MAEEIFTGQGIFEDVRSPIGSEFESLSGIDTTLEDVSDTDFKKQKSRFDLSQQRQKQSDLIGKQAADRKRTRVASDALAGVSSGLSIGGQNTGSTEFVSADSIIQVLGGIGTGALVGGPVGALAGGLAAGLQSFLGTRANKRKAKKQKAKEDRYQKMVREQIKREDAFRKQDRFDRLGELDYNRTRQKMVDRWTLFNDFSSQLTNVINSNSELKSRFAKEGF